MLFKNTRLVEGFPILEIGLEIYARGMGLFHPPAHTRVFLNTIKENDRNNHFQLQTEGQPAPAQAGVLDFLSKNHLTNYHALPLSPKSVYNSS